jgi:hypothetical protein
VPVLLQDDPHRRVERVGDSVRRPAQPWTPEIHALLRYLADVDFPFSPRALGFDEHGREVLTYLDGESGPAGWAAVVGSEGLTAMARLLRTYHDAVAGHRPAGIRDGEVVCHGDFGPWNLVWAGHRPVGIIDWDHAHPARPLHDVAYALEYVAPFRADEECLRWLKYPEPPDRRRRIETFAEAYGLTSATGLVDEVITQQREVRERVRQLAAEGRQPQAARVAAGRLDEIDARIRWSLDHRHLFA